MCKQWLILEAATERMLRAPATLLLSFFLSSFFLLLLHRSPSNRRESPHSSKDQNTLTVFTFHQPPGPFPFNFIFSPFFSTCNTITYIFTLLFSLPLSLSLFAIMEDEWREKHTIYRLLIHAHHCRKKVGSGGGGKGGGLDTAIDNLLYQPFPWQPAEQGQRAAMHFAPVYFIYLL